MSEAHRLVLNILRKIDVLREAVWEEGYQAGWTHANACERDNPAEPKPTNPYTADREQSQRDAEEESGHV